MQAALSPKLAVIEDTASKFGPRLQSALFHLKSAFVRAASIADASDKQRQRSDADLLENDLTTLDDVQDAVADTDIFHYHINVLADTGATLAWVLSEDPAAHVAALRIETAPNLASLRRKPDASHSAFADAAEDFISAIAAFVASRTSPLSFVNGRAPNPVIPSSASSSPSVAHSALHLKAFRDLVIRDATTPFQTAASDLRGSVASTTAQLCAAISDLYNFIVDASLRNTAPSEEDRHESLRPLIARISSVSEAAARCLPSDPMYNHVKSIEEAMGMLSWVVADSKPTSFVSDAAVSAAFYLNKILTSTKKASDAAQHKSFVDGLKALFEAMRAYIKEHHTMGLRYGLGTEVVEEAEISPVSQAQDDEDDGDSDDYASAFKVLLSGPVARFVSSSKAFGGDLAKQADLFNAVWQAELDFLEKAVTMPKPDDVQPMLEPIGVKMQEIAAVTEAADPRGEFVFHLSAVSESISALGWVAVDEKATSFVGDMAGAGQFYIDKVKMGAKKTSDPSAHREWAQSLETAFADLKAYVKEYHTQKLVWNPVKVSKVIKKFAKMDVEDDDGQGDYVSAFKELLSGPLKEFLEASKVLGGEVERQSVAFAAAWNAEASFLTQAIVTPKPDDVQSMLEPIGTHMGEVGAITEAADPRGELTPHLTAVSESVSALGWVAVDEKATVFVADMIGAAQFFVDKVKMGARKSSNPGAHKKWVSCLETLLTDLKAYVKEHHTQTLVWNPPKTKKRTTARSITAEVDSPASDYVAVFQELLSGPLKGFVDSSNALGGDVAQQAKAFSDAWVAEGEFLKKAIVTPKPDDVQPMLGDIAAKMAEVSAMTEAADPRGPFFNHLSAVSECMGALGWVAVDEKATAFVGDMTGTGQFYIDKVKMGAKKSGNPKAHREWADALEGLLSALKAYVKEHHVQKLVWNPPKVANFSRAVAVEEQSSSGSDYVTAFRELMQNSLPAFMKATEKLGNGDVTKQAQAFSAAWEAEAKFLGKAITMKKPEDVTGMLAPISAKMHEVAEVSEQSDPRGHFSNHCNAVSESIGALGWVAVDEKAAVFVGDMAGAGQFFIDKVKMSARGTSDPAAHRTWAKALETLYIDLRAYVKEYHTQRLIWKP